MKNMIMAHRQCLRAEERTDAATYTYNTSVPIMTSPTNITTLSPYATFSDTPSYTYIFLSTLPYDNPEEDLNSVTDSAPSDSPRAENYSLLQNHPSELPTEKPPEPTFPSELPTEETTPPY